MKRRSDTEGQNAGARSNTGNQNLVSRVQLHQNVKEREASKSVNTPQGNNRTIDDFAGEFVCCELGGRCGWNEGFEEGNKLQQHSDESRTEDADELVCECHCNHRDEVDSLEGGERRRHQHVTKEDISCPKQESRNAIMLDICRNPQIGCDVLEHIIRDCWE